MNYSFVMGVNNIDELKRKGFEIKPYGDNYGLTFSNEQVNAFENYIYKNLKNGFWNEYLGNEKVFIFKFKNGNIKKYVLNKENENEVLELCKEFAGCDFESIDIMLKNNDFYAKTYYAK